MACIGNFFSWGSCCFISILKAKGSLGSNLPYEFVGPISGKYKHIPFPVRLVFQSSIVSLTCLGTKWTEEEKYLLIP